MTLPISIQTTGLAEPASANGSSARIRQPDNSDIGQRLEQMLWTEMLTYAGLDEAFSQGGGESASAFSRYVVESIARDLAESHPLGFGDAVEQSIASGPTEEDAA